jgi:tetratricopeptide (TPR) repeat protein
VTQWGLTAHGDYAYAAHIIAYHALQATFAGNGREAIDLLEAARYEAGPGASRTLRALFHEWAISAWALVGDGRQAARNLLQGDKLWDLRNPQDDPDWLYWMVRPSENPEAGEAFLRLGQPRTAEQLLTAGLDALPRDFDRDRGLYLMRIAHAQLAQRGRLDEAVATASRAADLVDGIESPRAQELMSDFLARLPRDVPEVRALLEQLQIRTRRLS